MTHGMPIPETVTLHIPFRVVKRGGRKEMQLPKKAPSSRAKPITRWSRRWPAHSAGSACWSRASSSPSRSWLNDEGIAPSYMTRVLRLTLLAPEIVEAILDGTQGPEVTLSRVLEHFPLAWEQQGMRQSTRWELVTVWARLDHCKKSMLCLDLD